MRVPEVVRRVRELLVVSTTLGIAAAAHLFAGGALPTSAVGWVVTVALTLPVVVWTARRRLTLPRLLPAMALLQVVAHTALSVMTAAPAVPASSRPATGAHAGHVLAPGSLAPPAEAAHLHHSGDPGTDSLMLAAHAVAVVAAALLLTAGDRAAAWVLVWLGAVALLVAGPPAGLARDRRPRVPARAAGRVPRSWVGRSGLRLRGPPRAVVPA